MSHGWAFRWSTGIRGRYHIAISELRNLSKVCEEYLMAIKTSYCFSGVENVYPEDKTKFVEVV